MEPKALKAAIVRLDNFADAQRLVEELNHQQVRGVGIVHVEVLDRPPVPRRVSDRAAKLLASKVAEYKAVLQRVKDREAREATGGSGTAATLATRMARALGIVDAATTERGARRIFDEEMTPDKLDRRLGGPSRVGEGLAETPSYALSPEARDSWSQTLFDSTMRPIMAQLVDDDRVVLERLQEEIKAIEKEGIAAATADYASRLQAVREVGVRVLIQGARRVEKMFGGVEYKPSAFSHPSASAARLTELIEAILRVPVGTRPWLGIDFQTEATWKRNVVGAQALRQELESELEEFADEEEPQYPTALVRFQNADAAELAVRRINGFEVSGQQLSARRVAGAKDLLRAYKDVGLSPEAIQSPAELQKLRSLNLVRVSNLPIDLTEAALNELIDRMLIPRQQEREASEAGYTPRVWSKPAEDQPRSGLPHRRTALTGEAARRAREVQERGRTAEDVSQRPGGLPWQRRTPTQVVTRTRGVQGVESPVVTVRIFQPSLHLPIEQAMGGRGRVRFTVGMRPAPEIPFGARPKDELNVERGARSGKVERRGRSRRFTPRRDLVGSIAPDLLAFETHPETAPALALIDEYLAGRITQSTFVDRMRMAYAGPRGEHPGRRLDAASALAGEDITQLGGTSDPAVYRKVMQRAQAYINMRKLQDERDTTDARKLWDACKLQRLSDTQTAEAFEKRFGPDAEDLFAKVKRIKSGGR